ncbi:MAG: efflux transporter outer membrane subunit [Desulfobacterales bacterium]|jgi:NodT family efflux transporter outer membrane factor (OMF) lipoprotein|nr:efflux transporter outer membrane subunit [Desulfobacterales bacterium]MDD3950230.1 efflux transporter outer membrane subunit [Desulfobacterales bacterium]
MKIPSFIPVLAMAAAVFSLASCSPFAPETRLSAEGELPPAFSLYPGDRDPSLRWWEEFSDPELNALIQSAFSDNLTLKKAWARLAQARAIAVQAGSGIYPDLTGVADAAHSRSSANSSRTAREYSVGLMSGYELDLWGKIRSQQEAANLEAGAVREDLNAAAVTLAAEVAIRWANIISRRMQNRLLEKQLKTNETYLELVELRFRKAMASALDVYQQRQLVEQVRAEIPLVEYDEQLLMHEMALLLGKPARTQLQINRQDLPIPAQTPAAGLPADLLLSRPDVRAAGLRLESADWDTAVARADRLPAISLTARAVYSGEEIVRVFDNWLIGLAGNLTAPILDGQKRSAEVDRAEAAADENLAAFRETVLTAVKEVEDALAGEVGQRLHIEGLEREIDAASSALNEARERYRKGLNDYLPVLAQLLAVQRLERDLVSKRTELFINRINLHRALGGVWTRSLSPDAGSKG